MRAYIVTVRIVGGAHDERKPYDVRVEARTRAEAIREVRREVTASRTRWDQQRIEYRARLAGVR